HDAPASVAPLDWPGPPAAALEEVVEPAGACHVAQHPVHLGALHDRHSGLGDRASALDGDPAAAGEMQDADALGPAFLADPDEVLLRALEPGGHHVAVVVPAGTERFPVPRVPRIGPSLDHVSDSKAIVHRPIVKSHGVRWWGTVASGTPAR